MPRAAQAQLRLQRWEQLSPLFNTSTNRLDWRVSFTDFTYYGCNLRIFTFCTISQALIPAACLVIISIGVEWDCEFVYQHNLWNKTNMIRTYLLTLRHLYLERNTVVSCSKETRTYATTADILTTTTTTTTRLVSGTDMVIKQRYVVSVACVSTGEARGARRPARGDSRIIMIMQAEQMLSPLSALVTQLN